VDIGRKQKKAKARKLTIRILYTLFRVFFFHICDVAELAIINNTV
jgi:hypothetical protein